MTEPKFHPITGKLTRNLDKDTNEVCQWKECERKAFKQQFVHGEWINGCTKHSL